MTMPITLRTMCPHSNFIAHLACLWLLGTLLVSTTIAEELSQFPLRSKYFYLQPMETGELAEMLDNAVVVDSRNRLEFEVVHIRGAHHVDVGNMTSDGLLALRSRQDARPLVFYCNGITCSKSYKAAEKAQQWGFGNVRVYDSGIFHWASKRPTDTMFFGKPLNAATKKRLLDNADFDAANISPSEFAQRLRTGDFVVIDLREEHERDERLMKLPNTRILSMEELVAELRKPQGSLPHKNLLIFDNVGKEVRWIQYYLEELGITDYFFMNGGVRQWYNDGFSPDGN